MQKRCFDIAISEKLPIIQLSWIIKRLKHDGIYGCIVYYSKIISFSPFFLCQKFFTYSGHVKVMSEQMFIFHNHSIDFRIPEKSLGLQDT